MNRGRRLYNGVRLLGDGPSLDNIERIDRGAIPMVTYMLGRGLQVDLSHFEKMERTLTDDMDRITEEVKSMTGKYVNLDSGDQVSHLLFKHLGLKQARIKFTKSGDRESVEDEVLTAIQHDHPVVPKIQEFKEFSKLRGTYVVPMPKLAQRTKFGQWRMFPKLGYTRVPSGRPNCKEPNLLAMPSRTDRGRQIRDGFITDPGWSFLSVDQSQIEVRIGAHNSKDPALCKVYHNQEDVYSDFATGAFHLEDQRYRNESGEWKYPMVDKIEHRYPSKTCFLAALYDVTAKGLLEQMPVVCKFCKKAAAKHDFSVCPKFESYWNEDNCQEILNAVYLRYPGILIDRKRNHARARRYGYVFDMWGRLLHVGAVKSVLPWVASAALREVGNFPYQSGAQGTIKLTMAEVYDTLQAARYLGSVWHPVLHIHDEILCEVRDDVRDEVAAHMKHIFENCADLEVPIKAGACFAQSWGSLPK